MAKIYADKKHINNGIIYFTKKYYKIHNYLWTFEIIPTDLVLMIMDYINDMYVVEFIKNDFDDIIIKQIIKNNNYQILNLNTSFKLTSDNYMKVSSTLNSCKLYDEKKKYQGFTFSSPVYFFNYFMKTHYNKGHYIYDRGILNQCLLYKKDGWLQSDFMTTIYRKIHDHRELVNFIVIFKMLVKIFKKN